MRRIFWKRVISGKQLHEGYKIPRGWGVSYIRWDADFYIIHPLPLNYLVAAARWVFYRLQMPWFVNKEKERILGRFFESYNRGFDDGWAERKKHMGGIEDAAWRDHARRKMKRTRKNKREREEKDARHNEGTD